MVSRRSNKISRIRRKLWLGIVPMRMRFYESARICNFHFEESDYVPTKIINQEAISPDQSTSSLHEERSSWLSYNSRMGLIAKVKQRLPSAADIKDLKIIESRAEPAEQTHSTVAVTKSQKKVQRATVCENLQANPTSSGNQAAPGVSCSSKCGNAGNSRAAPPPAPRSKPIDIQATRTNKNGNNPGSYGNTSSTPKSRGGVGAGGGAGGGGGGGAGNVFDRARRRNEACFGELADAELDDDFDFEGNLALFNKRALWEELRHAHKPDVVRQADDLGKFRHDENVLAAPPAPRRAVLVPPELHAADFVTDDGLRVAAAAGRLRARLWAALASRGLRGQAHTLLARAAADVALRLVGGGRRLDARNAHQAPRVVALCGAHAAGAAGLQAARLLASHGARAAALLAAPLPREPAPQLARELAALAPAGVQLARGLDALPGPDLVLLALHDPLLDEPAERYAAALGWAARARGVLVCVEPPRAGWAGLATRAAVLGGLPAALAPELGVQYLADVCVPAAVFTELCVAYRPPFGAASVLALHPAD